MQSEPNRRPPQVDKIVRHPSLACWRQKLSHDVIVKLIRQSIGAYKVILTDTCESRADVEAEIASAVVAKLEDLFSSHFICPVINATGIIINTNLGRAPLSQEIVVPIGTILSSYNDLELDLLSGKRKDRTQNIAYLFSLLTAAESALVVNNNAAAVMLAVNSLAKGREVIVSRGELVEIGGNFRLPDVIACAGGVLKEVGTTNRTRIEDYEKAISDRTGIILRCHRSNFSLTGFVEEVESAQLAQLARAHNVPFIDDLGSGLMLNDEKLRKVLCLENDLTVDEALSSGADLVLFSGDKLLGGSQAGIIIGRKRWLSSLSSNAMYRALRLDKLLISLLELNLRAYLTASPEKLLPIYTIALQTADCIKNRVNSFLNLAEKLCLDLELTCVETESAFGGGSVPDKKLLSYGISLRYKDSDGKHQRENAESLQRKLRRSSPPVIALVQRDKIIIDFRTVFPEDESALLNALRGL